MRRIGEVVGGIRGEVSDGYGGDRESGDGLRLVEEKVIFPTRFTYVRAFLLFYFLTLLLMHFPTFL